MKSLDISIQDMSKMEGHADLSVKVRNGIVQEVKIKLMENKRFFTQAIRNKPVQAIPQLVARICGTCSIAHTLCSIKAIENGLGIEPSEQAMNLKRLTMYGLMIRDHALHSYIFSLPDVFSKDSVLDFEGDKTKFLYDAFDIKRAGNKLSTIAAGRAVHAPFPVIGGFSKTPSQKELKGILPELEKAREKIFSILDVYNECEINYPRDTNFTAMCSDQFDFLSGSIKTTSGLSFEEEEYGALLSDVALPFSQALAYTFCGKPYMVGALARINLNKNALHKETKRDAKKYLQRFPSKNIFHNNLAQCIEILHCIDHASEIIESADFSEEKPPEIPRKECNGEATTEAPRGTLYYELSIAGNIVKHARIVVPTQQNQVNMEYDVKNLVQNSLKTMNKKEIEYAIEKLIRAYDPCISCASHFLKVRWV